MSLSINHSLGPTLSTHTLLLRHLSRISGFANLLFACFKRSTCWLKSAYQILFHLKFYSVYFFFFHIWFITLKYTQVFVHHIHVKFNWQRLFNLHSNNVIMHGYLPWLDIFWTSCTWNDTDCGRAWHTERLSFQSGTPANKNHGDNPQYIKPGSGSK